MFIRCPEKDALIRRNAKALRLLRQGFAYSYATPRPASASAGNGLTMIKFRALARLLKLEAGDRAEHGDWNGAVNSDLDAMQLGEMCVHGGAVIEELIGIAIQAIGRVDLGDKIEHLNAPQCRQAIARMDRIMKMHEPLALVIRQDEREELRELRQMFQQPDWRRQFAKNDLADGISLAQIQALDQKTLTRDYSRYMEKIADLSRRPYSKTALQGVTPTPAVSILGMAAAPVVCIETNGRTQISFLRTALALQAYRSLHGQYPQTLTQLTPAILPKVPADPFGGDAPLRYRRNSAGYLLYSIGPDGRDDHGQAIDDYRPGLDRMRHNVYAGSVGDIVAGVNK